MLGSRNVLNLMACFFIATAVIAAKAWCAEKAILNAYLNTEEKGERFVMLTEDGVLMKPEDLLEMGLRELPAGASVLIDDTEYIPLKAIQGLSHTIDEKAAAVHLTADPALLNKSSIDLAWKGDKDIRFLKGNAAFINYSLSYALNEDYGFKSLSLPFETGLSVSDCLLLSNFLYSKQGDEEGKFVRLLTSVTRDDVKSQRRYAVGDAAAFSGGTLGGGATLGGFSVSKNFSLTPYYVKTSSMDASGMLKTPSEVSVYVNDIMLRSEKLPPGEFVLQNVVSQGGSGNVVLVIKDAYGNEEKVVLPYYLSTSVLKPGLHEYSYNLGFKRERLGEKDFDYSGMAFSGLHRYGFTNVFTAGLRAEAEEDLLNAGLTVSAVLYKRGAIDIDASFSSRNGRTGYGASLLYSYVFRNMNARLSARTISREYSNLSLTAEQDRVKFEWSAGMGYNHKLLGSASLSYTGTTFHESNSRQRLSAFYSKRLFKDLSLFMTAARTRSETTVDEFFAGLNLSFGSGSTAGTSYSSQDGNGTVLAYYQKNPPAGTGFGYRAFAERRYTEGSEVTGNASVVYRAPYGIYGIDYNRSGGENAYTLNASGAMAVINRSAYATRPINDSFALVKVGNIKDVKVSSSNQVIGTTNAKGEVIAPGLVSYIDNRISIDDTDIPVNYSISEVSRSISTGNRNGVVVKFDVAKLQGFSGTLYLIEDAVKKPAEYAGLEIKTEDRIIEAVIGKNGEFYLENIPSGPHPARIYLKDKECRMELIIPESESIMVELGEVICETH